MPRNTADRILSRLDRSDPNACWPWPLKLTDTGYAVTRYEGRYRMAHRIVYEILKGKIPEGLDLDHLCRNRACCNPAHLQPVTNRENVLRGVGPTAINARKTHCNRGHLLEGDNVRICPPDNRRECRECVAFMRANGDYKERHRAYKRVWYLKNFPNDERHEHNSEYDQYWLHYYAMKYGVTLPRFRDEEFELPEAA